MKKSTVLLFAMICIVLFFGPKTVTGARLSGDDASVSAPGYQKSNLPPAVSKVREKKPTKKAVKSRQAADKPAKAKLLKSAPKKEQPSEAYAETSSPAPKRAENYVTIDFDNVDIAIFIKTMGEITGRNFVIDSQVKGNVTIYSPKRVSIAEAYKIFESVLEVHGYTAVPAGGVTKIIPSKDAKEKSIETRLKNEVISPEDKIVTQIVSLNHSSPDDMKRILDPLISRSSIILSYPPTGMLVITDVYSNVARLLKIIGALDVPGSGEQITVIPLKNANAQDMAKALTSIFQPGQAAAQRRSTQGIKVLPDERTNTVIVMASEFYTGRVKELIALLDREIPRGESTMHVYRLQNANAEDLAKVLMSLPQKESGKTTAEKGKAPVISKEVQILADKATNTLVISAARDDYRVLEGVIKSLDVPRAMVYLEALIMEVSVNKSFKLGVEWRGMARTASSTGVFAGSGGLSDQTNPGNYSIFPTPSTIGSPEVAANFPSGFAMGVLSGGIKIGDVLFPSIGAALQAIQQDQDIHILSTPQILTLDNEDAEIRVGQNVPYLTRQDTSASTPNVAYSNYEYRDVGVLLKVTPHINEDGFVRLKIGQEVTSIVSQTSGISGASAPTTLKRTANTTVIVKDSRTVVIGGIIGDSTTKTDYGVPFLSKIPLLGHLFKSKSNKREQTNLFIFITPRIVRNQADAAGIYQEKRGSMGEVKEGVITLHGKPGAVKTQPSAPQPQTPPQPAEQVPAPGLPAEQTGGAPAAVPESVK